MINKFNDNNFTNIFEGVDIKTTVHGSKALMVEFRMKAGGSLPNHRHADFEQIGYLLSGKIVLNIDGRKTEFNPGDSWCIAEGVPHSAEIIEDSVAVEVFTSPREDYVKLLDPVSE